MIVDGASDFGAAAFQASRGSEEDKKKFGTEALPKWLGYFEKLLGGKHTFFGEITWADIVVFSRLYEIVLSTAAPGVKVYEASYDPPVLAGFPHVLGLFKTVRSAGGIPDWIAPAEHNYKLTYFGGRGRAEAARLILKHKGIKFEDIRVDDITSLKDKLPFGQVPLLEDNGVVIAQSLTICRYLANNHGLVPKDPKQAALANMIVDGAADLGLAAYQARTGSDDAKKQFFSEGLPKWLGYFEKLLGGKKHFFDQVSWADIVLFSRLYEIAIGASGVSAGEFEKTAEVNDPAVFKAFPHVLGLYQTLRADKGIHEWLVSRPDSKF